MEIGANLQKNTQKLEKLDTAVTAVSQSVTLMDGGSKDTAKQVGELKALVDSVLPGSGKISKGLKDVEGKLKDFNAKLDKGVDNLRRQTNGLIKLAEKWPSEWMVLKTKWALASSW